MKLSARWKDRDRSRVNRAIQEAESKTSAEIVPVIAMSSGRYDRAEDIVGIWFAILATIGIGLWEPVRTASPGSWDHDPWPSFVVKVVVAIIACFIIGVVTASRLPWLRRWFIPQRQMRDEVESRSRQVFYDSRIHHTDTSAGIMLYVSMDERMATVLADRTVLDKLGQGQLDRLCLQLTDRLKSMETVDALCHTIEEIGNLLAARLPRQHDDVNELADSLILID